MLNRRNFILATAAAGVFPAMARAADGLAYTPGLVDELLAEGKTVFVDFYTSWCSTCAAQSRVIAELRKQNRAYDDALTFVNVDWDVYSRDELSARLNIPRRSTLVVLKGDQELGRIVAGTRKGDIKALLDRALQAAV
jgi:thiol-disulfide isomerase/thioredoxin